MCLITRYILVTTDRTELRYEVSKLKFRSLITIIFYQKYLPKISIKIIKLIYIWKFIIRVHRIKFIFCKIFLYRQKCILYYLLDLLLIYFSTPRVTVNIHTINSFYILDETCCQYDSN